MKRPSFQFYPADWRSNAKLRRCSEAARGAWMDVLCVLHDSEEYGVLRWPLKDIAQASGVKPKLLQELVNKGVLKGADSDARPYIYTPRHAGQDGAPVELVNAEGGPCWYCSRFVRDEHVRQRRGYATRFDGENQPPKAQPKHSPKPAYGEPEGDGASTSSASSGKAKSKTSAQPAASRFDDFWQAYPHKRGKKPSLAKWKAKRLDDKADSIIADVQARIRSDERWLRGVIPDPLTYINQERWDDELKTAPAKSAPAIVRGMPGPSETPLERAHNRARHDHHLGLIDADERDRLIADATAKHRQEQRA